MSSESHDLGPVPTLTLLAGYGDSYVVPGDEVYVVAEDCDYIYLNTGSNPVADGFNIIKAIFLPGVWQRRDAGAGASGLRFNTVAIGALGSGRLIDADIVGLVDGTSTAWVESVKDTWRWDATSALTADNITVCNPTANGVNPGRFIRKLEPAPEWVQQAAWFIDSTAASNEGAGSALDPLQSDDELVRRWGSSTGSVPISVPVTITYAQAPTGLTNLQVAIRTGGSLTVVGTPVINQTGVVLTAVTLQVRTPGAEAAWAVTGATLGAADVGKLLIITASGTPANVGAYARVLKDNGGGSVRISPFGTFTAATLFVQRTPAIGDTVDVVTPTTINVGRISFRNESNAGPQASPTRQQAIFDGVTLDGNSATTNGTIADDGLLILYARSIVQNLSLGGGVTGNVTFHILCGGGASNCVCLRATTAQVRQAGVTGTITILGRAVFQVDTYFQNALLSVGQGAPVNTQGAAWFDRSTTDSCIVVAGDGSVTHLTAVPDWGTANTGHGIKVQSGGLYSYTTKPTINGTLGAGREALIGGTDKLYADVPYVEGANTAALVLTA